MTEALNLDQFATKRPITFGGKEYYVEEANMGMIFDGEIADRVSNKKTLNEQMQGAKEMIMERSNISAEVISKMQIGQLMAILNYMMGEDPKPPGEEDKGKKDSKKK